MMTVIAAPESREAAGRPAKPTGRSNEFYAREAILEHIEDLDDAIIADQRRRMTAREFR